MSKPRQLLPPTASDFVSNADVGRVAIGQLEGLSEGASGELQVKPLLIGKDSAVLEFYRPKGRIDPEHSHPDHESICYLISGRLRVVIAGEEFIAFPGDSWIHRRAVAHYHEALEDSVQIEIKSPPIRTWD